MAHNRWSEGFSNESTTLYNVFQHFVTNSKYIKELFRATTKNFSDLQVFDPRLSQCASFSIEDQRRILSLVCGNPALVVIGQNSVKANVINEILHEVIFQQPILNNEYWRMVKIKHNKTRHMTLVSKEGYELPGMSHMSDMSFRRVQREDLIISNKVQTRSPEDGAYVQVGLKSNLLKTGLEIILAPTFTSKTQVETFLTQCTNDFHILVLYCTDGRDAYAQSEMQELAFIKKCHSQLPILFVCCNKNENDSNCTVYASSTLNLIYNQLTELQLLNSDQSNNTEPTTPVPIDPYVPKFIRLVSDDDLIAPKAKPANGLENGELVNSLEAYDESPNNLFKFVPYNSLLTNFQEFLPTVYEFCRSNMIQLLILSASVLNDAHTKCLDSLIVSAHDMQRDVQITPKRLLFAKEKEEALFHQLLEVSTNKHKEIRDIIIHILETRSQSIIEIVKRYKFSVEIEMVMEREEIITDPKIIRMCTYEIQDTTFIELNKIVSAELLKSVSLLRESVLGTVTRCLETLENSADHESYAASQAFKQILESAYHLDVTARSSSSVIKLFMDRVRNGLDPIRYSNVRIDDTWKVKVASQLISSVTPTKLAKSISQQFHEKLVASHKAFGDSLKQLDVAQQDRLIQKEGARDQVRKVLTPKIARLSLQSIALKDQLENGMPDCRREIGRGQYGIVYSCNMWGGEGPLAVKSVVPPDEKHWNDLALEFHYTWSLAPHPRIVPIVGVVIDKNYSNNSAAVLLMMPRLPKDLYLGLKEGLAFKDRIQIAIDVAEGIRFLHNQGLLHRDIKLKNILLDAENRGKVTDLGFCKPEAMMTHSIVGTPIHMAPELFSGRYDQSVDVYALGILYWYCFAGVVHLPRNFDKCSTKDELWTLVKKGLRPERLSTFSPEAWDLMDQCWQGDPHKRPLLGDVILKLTLILEQSTSSSRGGSREKHSSSDY